MYNHKGFLISGECPKCNRSFSIHIDDIDGKVKYSCSDCTNSLNIVPNRAFFAEVYDRYSVRTIADVIPIAGGCCNF